MSDKQDWMTVKQIADHFNMSVSQVAYMRGFPQIKKEKRKNTWYIDPKSVEDNIDNINEQKQKKVRRVKYW